MRLLSKPFLLSSTKHATTMYSSKMHKILALLAAVYVCFTTADVSCPADGVTHLHYDCHEDWPSGAEPGPPRTYNELEARMNMTFHAPDCEHQASVAEELKDCGDRKSVRRSCCFLCAGDA